MKHPLRPDVSVTLRVNGQDLKEYENEEEPAEEVDGCTEVVRYVESVVDANFSVEMQVAPSRVRCDYELTVYLDGKWVAGSLYQDSKTKTPGKVSVDGTTLYTDGQYRYAKFAFAPLHTSEFACPICAARAWH